QELARDLPGPRRRLRLVEHGGLVVVEGVAGIRLDVALHVRARLGEGAHALDVLTRDVRVLAAEVEQDGAGDGIGAIEGAHDAGAVVADRDVRVAVDRDLEGKRAAQAETQHAGRTIRYLWKLPERAQRVDRVADGEPLVELLHRLERLG